MSKDRKRRKREIPESIKALREQGAPTPEVAPAEAAPAAPKKKGNRGQFQSVAAVIKPDMKAYDFIKEWWKARQRGDFEFLYELSTEDGPLRAHFGDVAEFPETCRRKLRPVRGVEVGELRRIRLDGADEAHVIQVRGHQERENQRYTADRYVLLQTERGWRVHDVQEVQIDKSVPVGDVGVDHFDNVELPAWFVARRG